MRHDHLLTEAELLKYAEHDNWSDKLAALLRQQQESWPLLREGYRSLDSVETKSFEIGDVICHVQYNPGRLASTTAKVDKKSIEERKCFLCDRNLPPEQRGLLYDERFIILCNPYPIFPAHFTIPHMDHVPQEIRSSFDTLLRLSRDLEHRFTVFYNGPKSGASAPDHLHFQAGTKGFMPIDEAYDSLVTGFGNKIADADGLLAFSIRDGLRNFFTFECDDTELLRKAFYGYSTEAGRLSGSDEEPMMNIISSYQEGEWRLIVIPRSKHRPSMFYEDGDKRLRVSPAAVDLGGVIVTPFSTDFEKISESQVIEIFREVCLSAEQFNALEARVEKSLSQLL